MITMYYSINYLNSVTGDKQPCAPSLSCSAKPLSSLLHRAHIRLPTSPAMSPLPTDAERSMPPPPPLARPATCDDHRL